jgi:hypothetical protein
VVLLISVEYWAWMGECMDEDEVSDVKDEGVLREVEIDR